MKFKIFDGIEESKLDELKKLTNFSTKHYLKGEQIIYNNDKIDQIYLINEGSVQIVRFDVLGNRFIIGTFNSGNIFAESYALSNRAIEVDVFAATDATISTFSTKNIINIANRIGCTKLIENLMIGIAEKNHILSKRLQLVTQKTVRQRFLLYLSNLVANSGSSKIFIPLSRQELADYLNVDRTALYLVIKSLEDDGIIKVDKRHMQLMVREV